MNPWAWNMNANMIYLEAPVGVGFSKGSADDMKHISDDTTSSDNRDALKVKIRTDWTDQTVRPRLTFHNDVKISAFPEGQYFGPNYFYNSNEKSGKPSIFTTL